jgi:hypothetical protein
LYQDQRAHLNCDANSREFYIRRGTKQGDPISPIIFNSVLEQVMRTVKAKWGARKYGIQLGFGHDSTVTNMRFADDILLIGRSLQQIKRMIADVASEGARVGLELHPRKTKIQNNNIGYGSRVKSVKVDTMDIEVLEPGESTMYLGRALSLTETNDVELKHRLKKAWAKFGMLKRELTDKAIPLHLRLKLFHTMVTPTILYGCSSWVMTCARETTLRSTQMKMLRAVLGRKRMKIEPLGDIETWVDWVQRVTHEVRLLMKTHCVPDWVDEQRSRLEQWGNRLEQMNNERWAKMAMRWEPEGRRARGHPRARWADKLKPAPLSPMGM